MSKTAVGTPIIAVGKFTDNLTWRDDKGKQRSSQRGIHVLEDLKKPVLSKQSQKHLGMLHEDYPHTSVNQLSQLPSPNVIAKEIENRPAVATLSSSPSETWKGDLTLKELMARSPIIFDGECRPMKGPPCHFRLIGLLPGPTGREKLSPHNIPSAVREISVPAVTIWSGPCRRRLLLPRSRNLRRSP